MTFLCLAYPCDVDGGIDPVELVEHMKERGYDYHWRDSVCRALGVPNGTTDANLLNCARQQRGKWRFNVSRDDTNMTKDFNYAYKAYCSALSPHPSSQVINEFGNEQITYLKGFLAHDRRVIGGVRVLYLIGHAISNSTAAILRDNPADDGTCRSIAWPFNLPNCHSASSFHRQPSEVTGQAQQGDLVVFSSGLLTPEWVIEQLREADTVDNTIVIVVDSCYSGTWVQRMRVALNGDDKELKYTRILLQTSCGPDEEAYGQLFTPHFINLNFNKNYPINLGTQNPQFFDSFEHKKLAISLLKIINNPIGGAGNARSRNQAFREKVPYNELYCSCKTCK